MAGEEVMTAFRRKGMKIYDPRKNQWVISDNPALVMADLACRGDLVAPWRLDKALDNTFWDKIEMLADFCESPVKEEDKSKGEEIIDLKLLDEIEEIRRENNKHWMDILRLAFEVRPREAKALMRKITELDKKVSKLSEQLSKEE